MRKPFKSNSWKHCAKIDILKGHQEACINQRWCPRINTTKVTKPGMVSVASSAFSIYLFMQFVETAKKSKIKKHCTLSRMFGKK